MAPIQTDDNYDLVMKGWECQETDRGVPFYIHKTDGKTDWDHPYYTKVMEELDVYQDVRYAAYRTALKLRHLQKKFGLHLLTLPCLQSVMEDHGFPPGSTGLMDSQCLQLILLDLFHAPDFRHFDCFRQDLASELLHNYLLNLFDVARTGVLKVVSVKLALAALCNSTLTEKYQYFYGEIHSSRAFVSRDELSTFISDMIQIPDLLRESVAFGKNVVAAVDSCIQVAGSLGDGVPEKGFYAWLMREPQTLIWLPTMHRLITAETVKHDCKCSVCKAVPIVGFRYKCLQCFKFNLCQDCFFHCRVAKNHHVRHPIQEFCLPTTAKDETKAFLKVVRNKIGRRSQGSRKTAFLPVDSTPDQALMEWQMRAAPTPPTPTSPQHQGSALEEGEREGGEAASNDSGHSSDQGGEATDLSTSPGGGHSPTTTTATSPTTRSPRSLYDNSSSPARYLEERHGVNGSTQDRHSLIHLVHRLRRENRLLKQQLRQQSCDSDDPKDTWRSVATAQMSAVNTSLASDQTTPQVHPHLANSTVSPIDNTAITPGGQVYTSEFFNSILGNTANTTTATACVTEAFDITPQAGDMKPSQAEMLVFASTPALQATTPGGGVQKPGPRKPPRLTGLGERNTVSISYIHPHTPTDPPTPTTTTPTPGSLVHRAQVHSQRSPVPVKETKTAMSSSPQQNISSEPDYSEITDENSSTLGKRNKARGKSTTTTTTTPMTDSTLSNNSTFSIAKRNFFLNQTGNTTMTDKSPDKTPSSSTVVVGRKNKKTGNNTTFTTDTASLGKSSVSCDEMWADITPCTIRKKTSKPTRLMDSDVDMDDHDDGDDDVNSKTPTPGNNNRSNKLDNSRRLSTGCLNPPPFSSDNCGHLTATVTPKALKSYGSVDKLGFRTPGVDRSLLALSRGDSILKTPERQEIDKMIQWIDDAFPPDLSYSALSLFHDESSGQKHMLEAAEGIGQAMADLVQARTDQCYM